MCLVPLSFLPPYFLLVHYLQTIYPLSLTHRRRMEAEAKAKLRLSYIYKKQRWEFAPSLIGSFAHLLISLKSNERL